MRRGGRAGRPPAPMVMAGLHGSQPAQSAMRLRHIGFLSL